MARPVPVCCLTICLVILVILGRPVSGAAEPPEAPAFVPVAAAPQPAEGEELSCYLLGGWSKNGWLAPKDASTFIRGGETYTLYNLTGKVGQGVGSPPAALGEPCPETLAVSFAKAPLSPTGVVAIGGQIKALPRQPRLLSTDQKLYQDATAEILRQKGIPNPKVRLTQVIRLDLDGDGTDEVLVSATHYAQGLRSRASPGDYSLVFLRHKVRGQVVTSLIEGDFFPRGVAFGAPGEHRIGAVLDLNGDGLMEIILFGRYYEGEWVSAYRLAKEKIIKILSAGCGA